MRSVADVLATGHAAICVPTMAQGPDCAGHDHVPGEPLFGSVPVPPAAAPVDAPGTCHLVGCAGKGTRDHHVLGTTIGVPSDELWAATSQPSADRPRGVIVPSSLADRARVLLECLTDDVGLQPVHAHEAALLAAELRSALGHLPLTGRPSLERQT